MILTADRQIITQRAFFVPDSPLTDIGGYVRPSSKDWMTGSNAKVEKALEEYRPPGAPSRQNAIYFCPDEKACNAWEVVNIYMRLRLNQ